REAQIARNNDHIRGGANQVLSKGTDLLLGTARTPSIIKPDIAVVVPAQVTKRFAEDRQARLSSFVIFRVGREQQPDTPHACALLRERGKRPCCRNATYQRNEFAPPHPSPPDVSGKHPIGSGRGLEGAAGSGMVPHHLAGVLVAALIATTGLNSLDAAARSH